MINVPSPDGEQIKMAIAALHGPTSVIELRAIHKGGRKRVDAGYFDGEHREVMVAEAIKLNNRGAAVYMTMNAVDPQLLARTANRIQEYAAATATDANVIRRNWMLIDIDPQRPTNTSATGAQLTLASKRETAIFEYLRNLAWPDPVRTESGNGFHLLYRIDLPNDDTSLQLIVGCLKALAARFDDDAVKVDRAVSNAARIVKVPGTVANKGDNVPSAPWRVARLISIPDPREIVSRKLLLALAAEVAPPLVNIVAPVSNGRAWSEHRMQAFLERGGIEAGGPEPHGGVLRWTLKSCPFNAEHGFGESAVFLSPDGRLGFKCFHNSCADKRWTDLRELVDGHLDARRGAASVQATKPPSALPTRAFVEQWPVPTTLPDGLPPVMPFDYELLPPVLHSRVQDIAERMQCPPDFPATALMVTLSSLIGRRCGIAPKRADDWLVVPNLWGMVIGRPGIMKSPPLTEVMRPLQVLQERAFENFKQDQSCHQTDRMVYEETVKATRDAMRKMIKNGNKLAAAEKAQDMVDRDEPEPVCRRFLVNDVTVEKLGEILNQNRSGVLVYRDELNGFFRNFDRQGHEADRAFYLECWSGDGGYTYDRIGRGTLHIEGACLSVLGSIQPGPLSALVKALSGNGDDGLLQRFQLAVWPDATPEWRNIDRLPDYVARDSIQALMDRCDGITAEKLGADPGAIPLLRFSEDAQTLFDMWRANLEPRLRDNSLHPVLEAHLSKYRKLVPALALIIHLAEVHDGPVERLALERSIGWAEYLESHARRIYAPAISPDMDAARLLANRIKDGAVGAEFALRDIYNRGWTGLSTRDEVAAAVSVLIDYDWLRASEVATSGRTRTAYRVNPAVVSR